MATFSVVASRLPTNLVYFELVIRKEAEEAPTRKYNAGISDAGNKQMYVEDGDIETYLDEASFDALEDIIEELFEKAKTEMLP